MSQSVAYRLWVHQPFEQPPMARIGRHVQPCLGPASNSGRKMSFCGFVAGLSNHSKKKAKGNRKARQQHLGSLAVSIVCRVGTRSLCFLLLPSNLPNYVFLMESPSEP